ncbi:MAG TPA: UBP-type zinc finger domain-containing protein [Gemmatimonadota bacterium]|nr:UBP-type zinc finger domain-containing protein [Gemmatimonadota bacterium]
MSPAEAAASCTHLDQVRDVPARTEGCEECLKTGRRWVHLRMCRSCGHVGCCDSSPNRHATAHFLETGHPIVRSAEPGESWSWCFVDETVI